MTPFDIVQHLANAGVTLRIIGNAIRYTAPRGAMTPDLRAALIEHKPEILHAFNERAAIMEYDGGLDRAEAERRATSALGLSGDDTNGGTAPCKR